MLKDIEITNFKKIKHLKLENLSTINILVGNNAVGKTTILEAIDLSNKISPTTIHDELLTRFETPNTKNKHNTDELLTLIENLFYYRDISNTLRIKTTSSNNTTSFSIENISTSTLEERVTNNNLTLKRQPSFLRTSDQDNQSLISSTGFLVEQCDNNSQLKHHSSFFINDDNLLEFSDANQEIKSQKEILFYNSLDQRTFFNDIKQIRENKNEAELIRYLQLIEPNIQNIEMSESLEEGKLVPFIDIKGIDKRIPYNYLGSGAKSFIFIFSMMIQRRDTIFLFDEIEYSIYYKTLPSVLKAMFLIAQTNGHQIIMVSHSKDLINSINEIHSENHEMDVSTYILKEAEQSILVSRLTLDDVKIYIQNDHDVRG